MTSATLSSGASTDLHVASAIRQALAARIRDKALRVVFGLGFPMALLLIWQWLAATNKIDARFFPSPWSIVTALLSTLADGASRNVLLMHIGVTLQRALIGYVLGAAVGVGTGLLMGLSAHTRYALQPLIYSLFPVPKIAIYPLMIIIFGIGDASSEALVFAGVFFMTSINTLSGVVFANPIYLDVAKAFRMPLATRWFRVVIPAAMPSVITGLRLGIGQALLLVVSGEFVQSDVGIGRYIWDNWQILNMPKMFVGLLVVTVIGGSTAWLGNFAERRLIPWK